MLEALIQTLASGEPLGRDPMGAIKYPQFGYGPKFIFHVFGYGPKTFFVPNIFRIGGLLLGKIHIHSLHVFAGCMADPGYGNPAQF